MSHTRKQPWVLSFEPYSMGSHRVIIPELLKVLKQASCHVEKISAGHVFDESRVKKIKQHASCLIIIPPLALSIEYLARLRSLGLKTPAIILEASHLAAGGLIYAKNRNWLSVDDSFVCCSSPEKKLLSRVFPKNQIFIIPYPVTNDLKPLEFKKREEFRQKLGLSSKDKMILYAGRLTRQKNIHQLILSFSKVAKAEPRAKLFLAGKFTDDYSLYYGFLKKQDYEKKITGLIEKLKLQEKIKFLGHVPYEQMRYYFGACDLHVSLSVDGREEFGYSVAEGLMTGAPTLVSKWGGGVDFVRGRGAADISVQADHQGVRVDVGAAAEKMLKILRSRAKWKRNALSYARKNISSSVVFKKWQKVLIQTQKTASQESIQETLQIAPELFQVYLEFLSRAKSLSRGAYYQWVSSVYSGQIKNNLEL
jgi:glycosyltransferase involved in cell wall biosynthesis